MYIAGMCFGCAEKSSRLGALGFDWFSAAGAVLGSAMKQGGGGGGPITTTDVSTATSINTQISPQISPIFIQQDEPSNSPVNAGAAMQPTGFTPRTGSIPGLDYEGYLPPSQQTQNLAPYALAGLGLIGLAVVLRKKKS